MKEIVFAIDGALTYEALRYNGAEIAVPPMDYRYKFGALWGSDLMASVNGYEFVPALAVEYEGKTATKDEMVKALWN